MLSVVNPLFFCEPRVGTYEMYQLVECKALVRHAPT